MILETIFTWVGGLFLILLVLTLIMYLISWAYNRWLKHRKIFWRCIYLSLILDEENKHLNKVFKDIDGKKYKNYRGKMTELNIIDFQTLIFWLLEKKKEIYWKMYADLDEANELIYLNDLEEKLRIAYGNAIQKQKLFVEKVLKEEQERISKKVADAVDEEICKELEK